MIIFLWYLGSDKIQTLENIMVDFFKTYKSRRDIGRLSKKIDNRY